MSYPPPGGYPGYPAQPGQPGYGVPPGGAPGYPPASGYPPQGAGYPQQSGFPPAGTGFPSGYPPAAGGGYPPAGGGYPPAGGGGYPPAAGGYPPAGYPQGQPPQAAPGFTTPGYGQPPATYPQQPPVPGYGQPAPAGYGQPPGGYGAPQQQSYQPPPAQAPMYGQPGAPPPGGVPPAEAPPPAAAPPARPPPPAVVGQPPVDSMEKLSMASQSEGHGTVRPVSPFDAEQDCELLRKAMRGAGTDEATILNMIATRSNKQRQEIKLRYKTMYGKDLIRDLQSELSGNLEECLLALFESTTLFDAKELRRAMRGAGTDECCLIEILCTRTNSEIHGIREEYKNYYKRDLEKDCVSETSGHFKRLLVSMCQGNRDESNTVDMAKATKEASDLFQAGEKKWGTDESRFNVVLATRNIHQLRATFQEYVRISQRDILNSIDREMSGDLKEGFKAVVHCVRNRPTYFAEQLYKSMKGAGTNDSALIRLVVSRSEIDLVEVKLEFLRMYNKTLYKMIEGDCSGDYKKLLLAIVGSSI